MVLQCLIKSGIVFCLHHQRLPTLPLEFIIVCKPHNRVCTLLNTSIEAHNVITHDLVHLMIFCHDSKLCVSTIITFENSYYNKLYKNIVQTGQYTELAGYPASLETLSPGLSPPPSLVPLSPLSYSSLPSTLPPSDYPASLRLTAFPRYFLNLEA